MATTEPEYDPKQTGAWLVCKTCGTQFPTTDRQNLTTCFICDDPRQYTPPSGQSFTTLDDIRSSHKNTWTPFPGDDSFVSIVTEPKFAIGQRAVLIKTPVGNVMWDCVSLLDDETIEKINALGGLKAIVISHPHYWSTHVEWGRAFKCPVYLAVEDQQWATQSSTHQAWVKETEFEIKIDGKPSGVEVLKLGGHFPGSFVVLYAGRLLIADTLFTTPAGMSNWDVDALGNARSRPKGANSYSFMWSIPNQIPLSPDEMARMWSILKKYKFRSTHGAFLKTDVMRTENEMRQRVLDSMQIQAKFSGHQDHPLLDETV